MKIVLGAFACSPDTGSEGGVGWRYATWLAQRHEVWVLTDPARRAAIEAHPDAQHPRLHFCYYRAPRLSGLALNWATAHLIYQTWQLGAWRVAQQIDLESDVDLVWHLTYGVYRQPSRLWRIGKPFVIGPVGGGETAPLRLWPSMGALSFVRETVRSIANLTAPLLPGFGASYRAADLVLCKTAQTQACLPRDARKRSAVRHEIGGLQASDVSARRRAHGAELRFIYAGRLLGMKGVALAIEGLAWFLRGGGHGRLEIVGAGPRRAALQALVARLALQPYVRFTGQLPQAGLFERLRDNDVFVFPSLHDSSGNVVLEAMSFGLPVICLDLGGPPTFVDRASGIVVETRARGSAAVAQGIGEAMLGFAKERSRLARMSAGALARAADMSWDRQIERVFAEVDRRVFTRHRTTLPAAALPEARP